MVSQSGETQPSAPEDKDAHEKRVAHLTKVMQEWLTQNKVSDDHIRAYVPGTTPTSAQISAGTRILEAHNEATQAKLNQRVHQATHILDTLQNPRINKWELVDLLKGELNTNESEAVFVLEQLKTHGYVIEDKENREIVVANEREKS